MMVSLRFFKSRTTDWRLCARLSIVRAAAGDHDHVPVRVGDRLEEPYGMAVLRGDALHLDGVPGVEGVRPDFPNPPLREGRGRAQGENPLGCRGIRILDRDRQRTVGIHKLYFFDRPRKLLFRFHVVDTGEGMMSPQGATSHQPYAR